MLYNDGIRDNAAAIQEMLDGCGIVMIDKPGDYLISKTLVIHSNTRFVLAPGARLLAVPMSRCALIDNEHIRGDGKDKNIEIIGGIWDGNCDNQGYDAVEMATHRCDEPYTVDGFRGKLMRFAHVDNLCLEKLTVKDPCSYGIQIGASNGFVVRDILFDYNFNFGTTDGVHINGGCFNGVIENLTGATNDDMVSLTPIDECHAEITVGDIANIEIRNVTGSNCYSGIRLLSGGGYTCKNIRINGVYGDYRHDAVLLGTHSLRPGTTNFFDDIVIEHVHARKTIKPLGEEHFTMWEGKGNAIKTMPVVWFGQDAVIGRLTLRDISRHEEANTTAPLVFFGPKVKVARLVAENIHQTAEEGINCPSWICEAQVDELITRDVMITEPDGIARPYY